MLSDYIYSGIYYVLVPLEEYNDVMLECIVQKCVEDARILAGCHVFKFYTQPFKPIPPCMVKFLCYTETEMLQLVRQLDLEATVGVTYPDAPSD